MIDHAEPLWLKQQREDRRQKRKLLVSLLPCVVVALIVFCIRRLS